LSLIPLGSCGHLIAGEMSITPKRKQPAAADTASAPPAKRAAPGRPRKEPAAPVGKPAAAATAVAATVAGDPTVVRLKWAAAALRPGATLQCEGRLPCRDQEHGEILGHLQTAIGQGGSMQVLYISGMPGTGKTASVMQAIKQLQNKKSMQKFAPVHINAMRLGTPQAAFGEMYRQLPGKKGSCAVHAAYGELTKYFNERRPSDPVVLLVIDEIDHLITRNQAVLYKIFDWLSLPSARMVVASISNTMDLPERLLPRVASRFPIVRVDYAPYRRDQIVHILEQLLKAGTAIEAFDPVALKLCAARVAAGSGDIRKALQLCRRAVEVRLSLSEATGPAGLPHLEVAERELLRESPAACAIGGLGFKARRLLTSLLLELRKQPDADSVSVKSVASRYGKLLTLSPAPRPVPPKDGEGWAAAGGASEDVCDGLDEEVPHLVRRLEAISLLVSFEHAVGFDVSVALGAGLDAEDLVGALADSEDDPVISKLIRESTQRGD